MKLSVIIPTYNEDKHIKACLESLLRQDYLDREIIVVDDGSTDKTRAILQEFSQKQEIIFLKQNHLGPGHARNLGASFAGGEILVFVDADMSFSGKEFLHELAKPIIEGKSKGTFSKEEYVANWARPIARYWQYNRGIFDERMIPKDYPDHAPIFRAILKSEFQKVQGFNPEIGYTDDWTLSRKLGYESDAVTGGKYFHYNPDELKEVLVQAKWIGKNEFISGNLLRKFKSILKYNFLTSIIKGVMISFKIFDLKYLIFQLVYDFGVLSSVFTSFASGNKIK